VDGSSRIGDCLTINFSSSPSQKERSRRNELEAEAEDIQQRMDKLERAIEEYEAQLGK